jgi:hypothetical protein
MEESLVDQFSYSAMNQLMSNPLAFKKKYILRIFDDLSSPSGVVGKAGHKALEAYFKGKEQHEAIEVGLEYINNLSDSGIKYGKTGSRDKIIRAYNQAINFYFEEFKAPHEILGVEEEIVGEVVTMTGDKLSLPIKGFIDLPSRNKLGEIEIIDHKFVSNYTNGDEDNFKHWLQSMFNYHMSFIKWGEYPARMIFNECKVSKNTNGDPQIQPYVIEFKGQNMTGDLATFYKLFESCVAMVSNPSTIYLPNPNDIFDGQNSFEIFRSGVIGVEAPVGVKHKTEQKQYVEKNFVPSAIDKVGNENLTDEEKIRLKLVEFGITADMQDTHVGAAITQYTFKVNRGVKMSSIANLGNDIALALGAESVRIEAPIKGTTLIGVEVPSKIRGVIPYAEQHIRKGTLDIPIGVDVFGTVLYKSLAEMPHWLIAGATGSGKSVMLNVALEAITKQNSPSAVKLVLIDPKQVELTQFEKLPHLLMPVVTNNVAAAQTLEKMVVEMEKRYKTLREAGVRSIDDYTGKMPKIIIVVDEFADLMMMSNGTATEALTINIKQFTEHLNNAFGNKMFEMENKGKKFKGLAQKDLQSVMKETMQEAIPNVEHSIIRIAQKARAVGMHLILATQRPSADVVTGLIKANIPTKTAFMTTSATNSRIILDEGGAEKLIGKGDMLFLDPSGKGLKRLQGLYL